MNAGRFFRTTIAIFAGILIISTVVELLEFSLVTLVNGEPTTDLEVYFGIRNMGWFLAAKLLYNTLAAVGAGFLVALIAGWAPVEHGILVAVLQTISFVVGLLNTEVSRWTPGWMWVALIVVTFVGIIAGSRLQAQRMRG